MAAKISTEGGAHHNGRPRSIERSVVVAGILECRVRSFQEHKLKRIGVRNLFGRDLVPFPVVDEIGNEATQRGPATKGAIGVRIVVDSRVPAIGRYVAQAGPTARQQLPVGIQCEGLRQDAPHTDNRDPLGWFLPLSRISLDGKGRHRDLGRVDRWGAVIQHDVDVQTTDAEGVDGCTAGAAGRRLRPLERLGRDVERDVVPINLRIRRAEVDLRRNDPVMGRQNSFQQAGNTGGFQCVTDVGFHAANGQLGSPG